MFNKILSIVIGLIVAFIVTMYMVALGIPSTSIIVVCLLTSAYTSALVALLLDKDS